MGRGLLAYSDTPKPGVAFAEAASVCGRSHVALVAAERPAYRAFAAE